MFFSAWLAATLLGGIPSTLWAIATGSDALQATRAAGAMLLPASSSTASLLLAAALVHTAVSLFWCALLFFVLPRRHALPWAVVAAALIAVLDLRVIAPRFFPEVAALDFWPQLTDHLWWGGCFGWVLQKMRSDQHFARKC